MKVHGLVERDGKRYALPRREMEPRKMGRMFSICSVLAIVIQVCQTISDMNILHQRIVLLSR
jgi:hypothetical protein